MKFDHILMNPPFCRNLHLKILNEAICYSDDIVNLSPIRWLQDPLAEYKKNSDWKKFEDIRKKIESLDVISREYAAEAFNIRLNSDLGVYHLQSDVKNNFDLRDQLAIKMYKACKVHLSDVLEYNKSDGWRVRLSDLRPLNAGTNGAVGTAGYYYKFTLLHPTKSWVYYNGYQNNKHWSFFCGKTGCKHFTDKDVLPCSIRFDTEMEANNFEGYTKTKTFKYALLKMKMDQHTPFLGLPFMPGYTHPWTDEMLYEYFNLTPEEIQAIKNEFKDEV